MASEDNLKKFTSEQSRDKAKENGKKGGIASGEARRRKKAIKETLEVLLTMPMKESEYDDIAKISSFASLNGKNINVQDAMAVSMIQRALKGNVRAAEWVRDSVGEKPTDSVNVVADVHNPLEGLTTEELRNLIGDE